MSYVKARDDRERSSSRRYEDPAAGAVDRIWRHHPQAMRDWYNILVDATVDEVNAKTADAFYKAGTSIYSIKTVVSPYGLPRNFIVALYSPRDETLVVGSPRLVGAATNGAMHLGLTVQNIEVQDNSQNPMEFFGDVFVDELYSLARQSGRSLNDRTRILLPQSIQDILDEHFRLYDELAIPDVVRDQVYKHIGRDIRVSVNAIPSACAVCGPREIPKVFMCQYCARDAAAGLQHVSPDLEVEAMQWGMSQLAIEFGGPFSLNQVARPPDTTLDNWSVQAVARMTCRVGGWSWSQRLVDSGVVPDGTRPSWGMYSRANDGHWCRSLLEREIDDFFYNREISHETEPKYPHDSALNPRGRLRADWKLADGTFVEAFGALRKPEYAAKAEIKRQLVVRHGIHMIELTPQDAHRLNEIFHDYLPGGAYRESD